MATAELERSAHGETLLEAKQHAKVSILLEVIKVQTSDIKFTGDAPADVNSSGDGNITSNDFAKLFSDTIAYKFTPGVVDKIEFKDKGDTTLGTWVGKLDPALTSTFTYPGTW